MSKCGCGKDGKYMFGKGDDAVFSCNKYSRCPTYEDIEKERDVLKQVAYCANGMLDSEKDQNFGDAKEWKRHLELSTEEYYESYNQMPPRRVICKSIK